MVPPPLPKPASRSRSGSPRIPAPALLGLLLPAALLSQCAAPGLQNPLPPPAVEGPAPPDASCRGRVLRALDLLPVADARVEVLGTGVVATSGADGGFHLEGIPPGARTLVASPPDHMEAILSLELSPGVGASADLYVLEGATIEGRVLDEEGSPVAGARVGLSVSGNPSALTDAEGRYRLRGVPSEPYFDTRVHCGAPGFRPGAESVWARPGYPLLRRDFVLDRTRPWRVEGSVLRKGRGVAGVVVRAQEPDGREFLSAAAETDGAGAFRIVGEGSRRSVRIVAIEDGQVVGESGTIHPVVESVVGGVLVFMKELRVLEGTLQDAAGSPMPGNRVRAEAEGSDIHPETVTDASSTFRLHLPPGAWKLSAEGRGPGFLDAGVADVPPAGAIPSVDLVLPAPSTSSITLRGRVVDEEGRPVPGANVRGAITDSEGRFEVEIPGGSGEGEEEPLIRVYRRGYPPRLFPAGRGMGDMGDLVLERGAAMRGRVLLPDGRTPARCFEVQAFPDEGSGGGLLEGSHYFSEWDFGWSSYPFSLQVPSADGTFRIDGLEEGIVAVVVRSGDLVAPIARGVRVSRTDPGEEHRFVLGPGATLALEVLDPEGRPAAGQTVTLMAASGGSEEDDEPGEPLALACTDAAGRAEFRVLHGDPVWVVLEDGHGEELSCRRIVVPDEGTVRLGLAIPGTGTLRLEAGLPAGSSGTDVRIEFLKETGDPRRVLRFLDDHWDGTRALEAASPGSEHAWGGIAEGDYRALVRALGCRPAEVRFSIHRGAVTTLRVDLAAE